ncbi:ligand-binding sensor domain-containing protein [Ekhidna sp.]
MKSAIIIISTLITATAFGQYRFDHINTIDGLSQNSVNDIFQDSEGFIWLATQEGLNRYDGYEFVKYTMEGEMDMAGNFLWSIIEDDYGNIWTASSSGATRLDWRNGSSTHFVISNDEKFRGQINQVLRVYSKKGKVIIGFNEGSYILDPLSYLDSATVLLNERDLLKSSHGEKKHKYYNSISYNKTEYLLTHTHLIKDEVDSIVLPKGYSCSRFKSELLLGEKGIFIGTDNGMLHYNFNRSSMEHIPCIQEPVNDIIWGPEKKELWVATDNGIYLFNPYEFSCSTIIQSGEGEYDLTSNTIAALMKDKDGLIWAGTANGGVNIYDPRKDRFKFLSKNNGFSDKAVWSVYLTQEHLLVGADNGLYVGSVNGSITENLFAETAINNVYKFKSEHLQDKRITAIEQLSEHEFIVGTFEEELITINLKTKASSVKKLNENDITPHVVSAIKELEEEIWVTTHNGLFLFSKNLELKEYFHYQSNPKKFPTNYYLSAFVSKDGTVWVGNNVGFYTISPDQEFRVFAYNKDQLDSGPAFNFVSGFFEDYNGDIWVSTFGGGVSLFNRETEKFTHFDKSNGLANEICSAIIGSKEGVFVSTNGGISRIDIATHKITNYNTSDGLINNEFAIASSYQNGNDFMFGNVNGLVVFNPEDLKDNASAPMPVITKLSINYKENLRSRIAESQLEINPEDRIFSLEFSAMSHRKKDQITYQYSLTNFNENWVDAGPFERRATYSLPPGEYTFKVRTKSGSTLSEARTFAIVVHPAFYQTWWFYSIVGIGSILGVFLLSRYYSNQQLKKQLRKMEMQQKIQNERERISRDLHDNVGSQITYIATSINNLSGKDSPEAIKELGEFTRDTMRQLRETIWVINNDEVTIEELKTKVIDYLSEILQPYPGIFHEVHFSKSSEKLNPTVAINIFRLIQEAVNNSVKHANPKLIRIDFTLEGSTCLSISDDGIGFSGDDKMGHFGLINMRKRAKELGAEYQLETAKDKGTQIILRNFKIGQMT